MNITFNELRDIKDSLPDGSIHQIAKELDLNVETVWNYFGGYTHPEGKPMGVHLEGGADGGVVRLDDTRILDIAKRMIGEQQPQRV
ncbi:MAG: DNA-binding protein [Flavobacteriales bacterium]|nr:DNA-binding protein [Flavobacteriales bacterium]MBK6893590.1 DNA-binding protein [Flavobacteriales bacterium]MBK7248710.1 DNA-binding protein [Flavobacteriales bacterium]QQS73949.1 MAG: DNA-binding protein [Flavobacteriales bacterium]HQV38819.1 DNA-binding protein [Flavobacteriales bacterium]